MSIKPTNLLVLQDELVELLKSKLAALSPAVHVLTPDDLQGEDTGPAKVQPVPAVNVVYMGHRFSDQPGRQRTDGKAALVAQLFALEVVTRNVQTLKTGAAARLGGGQLAMHVIDAIMGARLPGAASPLALVAGPGPTYKGGMQYLPLLAQVDLLISR
jgi:hypothetical protein